ncbi:MAG: molybdopterin-guanine dinucleotide biosynthesis protein B [Planctomycetes bacterium]|nr:molybdopterin-guanine dinucleotide biosynthesis protein B [Planctomycetota bacterium]
MRLVSFVGPSNSGKTRMIEQLAAIWTTAGYRVGVLKHCSKGYQLDREGKDSERCWTAGAAVVGIVGPEEFAVRRREEGADPLEVIARTFPKDLDLVLLEGFHEAPVSQVRVLGPGEELPARSPDPRLLAWVDPVGGGKSDLPVFQPLDFDAMAGFLASRLGLRRPGVERATGPALRHESAAKRAL